MFHGIGFIMVCLALFTGKIEGINLSLVTFIYRKWCQSGVRIRWVNKGLAVGSLKQFRRRCNSLGGAEDDIPLVRAEEY
jgi:hypothetical protein